MLAWRLRGGVRILRDPFLLLRFLKVRLVARPYPILAVFFLDRRQRLLRFAEMFRGCEDRVDVRPREILPDAFACNAERLLCARSDPHGYHQPTAADIESARRVKRALDTVDIPLIDYVIVGRSVTSLMQRRLL